VNAPASAPLEVALRRVLEEQVRSIEPLPRRYGEAHLTNEPERSRPRRFVAGALVGLSVVVALVVGSIAVDNDTQSRRNENSVPPGNQVHFRTEHVELDAADFGIELGGRRFTAAVPDVLVHTDPGRPDYQTLELEWQEHGAEMRWYIYFTSDGRDWWANEMRTYNGRASDDADWVMFTGTFFRAPLGSAYTGDLDVTATTDGFTSHLVARGLRIQAFIGAGDGPTPD
jgi:hypothetical protein